MKETKNFLKIKRNSSKERVISERLKDYKEVAKLRGKEVSCRQGLRCMDCGVPFCHWACPLGSYIPEWNQSLASGNWRKAYELLKETNNFPEITGRLCPAICEYGCVLGINYEPVTIRENEIEIMERAFALGWVKPEKPYQRTGKKIAVIGSGPAGLAVSAQLNKAGHKLTVFEKADGLGGILRYGIPDFKLEKKILDRRIDIIKEEGVRFKTSIDVGRDYPAEDLLKEFDAVCLTIGASIPRDLNIEGRGLKGIYFAMDYLIQSNKKVFGQEISFEENIDVKNKNLVVIGGGDTGADCLGTALRQGAKSVIQIELMPKPSEARTENLPWPQYPLILKTSSSHKEGGKRKWSVLTKEFISDKGIMKKIKCVKVEFIPEPKTGRLIMKEISKTEFEIKADLVIIAIGFLGPENNGLLTKLGVAFDSRGNIEADAKFMTKTKGIFSAGDARRGQSLIAWAVSEGRKAAYYVDIYLMGKSSLPLL